MAAPVGASGRGIVWQVTVPSWRVDVTREIDLIEEVGARLRLRPHSDDVPGAAHGAAGA